MTLVIGLLLVAFMLSFGSANAYVWETHRNDVTVTSGNLDISDTIDLSAPYATGSVNVSGVVKLPCNIYNLSAMTFTIVNSGAATIHYNLTVNTKLLNSTDTVTAAGTNLTTKAQYQTASGDRGLENITWSFNASDACNLTLVLTATNAVIYSYWLTENLVMKERDITTPAISNDMKSTSSSWAVNNSIAAVNTWGIDFTGVILNVTYPSNKLSDGSSSVTMVALSNGTLTTTRYTQYQKRGPYLYSVEETISGNNHVVTVKVRSPEMLRDIVDWTLIASADDYEGVFDTINYGNLDLELNNIDIDWSQGSVVMDELTIKTSPTNNVFTFDWTVSTITPSVGSVTDQIAETLAGSTAGVPNFIWMFVVVAIIIVAYLLYMSTKPVKKSKKSKKK